MKALPFLIIIIMCLHSACNPFDDPSLVEVYPDTTITINSLSPQICDVKIADTDSSYQITSYWTDKLTGRILYKMKYAPYLNSLWHGTQMEFNGSGDTLVYAHFDKGVRVDSAIFRYNNGQIKQKLYYSSKQNGNILNEMNYHPNGVRKSDVIQYNKGLLNGAVTYYDDTERNRPTETYYYVDSEIVGIKIYNDDYTSLENRKNAMLAAYQKDSARIAQILYDGVDLEIDAADRLNKEVPIYIGTTKDAMYDVGEPDRWDILDEDPNFILKLGK